jgi:hypothetical protein
MNPSRTNRLIAPGAGFTLTEPAVVLVIVALLIGGMLGAGTGGTSPDCQTGIPSPTFNDLLYCIGTGLNIVPCPELEWQHAHWTSNLRQL